MMLVVMVLMTSGVVLSRYLKLIFAWYVNILFLFNIIILFLFFRFIFIHLYIYTGGSTHIQLSFV